MASIARKSQQLSQLTVGLAANRSVAPFPFTSLAKDIDVIATFRRVVYFTNLTCNPSKLWDPPPQQKKLQECWLCMNFLGQSHTIVQFLFISQANQQQWTFKYQSIHLIDFNLPMAQPVCLQLAPPFQALPLTPFEASSQRSSVVLLLLVELDEWGLVVAKVESLQGNKGLW